MSVYRFKVCLEDNEDIFRDIDIKAVHTFEDLHNIIQQAFKFDGKHAASFFVSDDYWRKGLEITLRKEDLPLDEEEIRKKVEPKKLMSATKVAKLVEQPFQRFVYVFDPEVQWTFLIEMIKITEENSKTNYPAIIRSQGNSPKQYKQTNMAKEELSPDLMLASLLDDPEIKDEEIFSEIGDEDGVEEEELKSLEGEEGEEDVDDIESEDQEDGDFQFDEDEEEH
ncbi:MAG: plasmid pRiA4b ORF-3 family protein [Bacteroidia bacterium]|nr:plasmid pRiA4b ORF-3 family protein [Bacteroidia bacterium]